MKILDMIEAKRREERRKQLIDDGMKCLAGLATGLAIGGAAGVLFAPKSGDETREDIKNFYNEKKDQAEEMALNAKERVQDKAHGIYDKGKKALDDAKDKADDMKLKALDKAEDAIDNTREGLEKAKKEADKAADKAEEKVEKAKK
ncbi:MAG: YtxH domain-containing protein [Ezakiella sp.]